MNTSFYERRQSREVDRPQRAGDRKAPAPAAPSSGPGSFRDTAEEALALQIEQELFGESGSAKDPQKEALESIDDIAARASVNFVKRNDQRPGSE